MAKKLKDDKVKKDYYEMSDKMESLGDNIPSDDPKLKSLVDELKETRDKLRNHLNENYLWD